MTEEKKCGEPDASTPQGMIEICMKRSSELQTAMFSFVRSLPPGSGDSKRREAMFEGVGRYLLALHVLRRIIFAPPPSPGGDVVLCDECRRKLQAAAEASAMPVSGEKR